MKVIQFLDSEHDIDAEATATAMWSVQKHGGLPENTQYILYTVNERHFNNPIINKVYDSVVRPPYDEEWLHNIDWSLYGYGDSSDAYFNEYRTCEKFWGKFLAFLGTPCDGKPVIQLDWDVLCRGSLLGAIPPKSKCWACYCSGTYCTNGFLVKTPEFEATGIGDCMKEPLRDPELYKRMHEILPSADEIGTTWYRQKYGDDTLCKLREIYCGHVRMYIEEGVPLSETNDRILHYVYKTKPWQGFYPKDNPYMKLWWDCHDDMLRAIGETNG